jgi:hypothetical protein
MAFIHHRAWRRQDDLHKTWRKRYVATEDNDDPRTLTRAARDMAGQPGFAMQAALAALHWMSMGQGYELTGLDAHEAHRLANEAAGNDEQTERAQATLQQVLAPDRPMSAWLRRSLGIAPPLSAIGRH